MAWLSVITDASTVNTTKSVDISLVQAITSEGVTKRLYQKTVTTVTEYRGLSRAAATTAAESPNYNADNRVYSNWTPFISTFVNIKMSGIKKTATASRANEADGWRLTVTQVDYSNTGDV